MQQTKQRAIVQTYSGWGLITFPQGGRIRSPFVLTAYATGPARLTCAGPFPQASYRGWEQLVHHYRLSPSLSREKARNSGFMEQFAGRTADNQQLTITRMFLVDADAHGVAGDTLHLRMQFDCEDAELLP
jgi:hypothetical protein